MESSESNPLLGSNNENVEVTVTAGRNTVPGTVGNYTIIYIYIKLFVATIVAYLLQNGNRYITKTKK